MSIIKCNIELYPTEAEAAKAALTVAKKEYLSKGNIKGVSNCNHLIATIEQAIRLGDYNHNIKEKENERHSTL